MRFHIFYSICLFCAICFSNCQNNKVTEATERPNVILVMTDDQGYGDLACHGNPYIRTPNLDRLYNESVRLTNFHVGTTCSPTRAALMTGRNCNRVGVWHTIAGRSQLSASEMTVADVFSNNKYQTGMFGKWHLGDSYPFRPHDRGFTDAFYHGGGGVWQGPDFWDNDYFDDTYFRNGKAEKTSGYCTDVWFDEALTYIEQHKDTPFFAYIATNAPHGPFHVDSSYIRPYLKYPDINPNFYGMITNFDDNMGRLINKLEELEIENNTVLIFMTDNGSARGASLDQDGYVTKGFNAGMRGMKGSEYEGGHRVPCFIRWPDGNIGGGRDIEELTAHVDLLPTFMDMLDLKPTQEVSLDGTSILPLLTYDNSSVDWKNRILITDTQRQETPEKWKNSSVMMNHWRLINGKELYDISVDPGQRQNIIGQETEIVSQLKDAYENWWAELEPGFEHFTRAVLGPENGETVTLYAHDWHEAENNFGQPNLSRNGSHMVPWNQTHIRLGPLINGYWEVEVAKSGLYTFELRRWPVELDAPIQAQLPGKPAVSGGRALPEGRPIEVSRAGIEVGQERLEKMIGREDKMAMFQLSLEAGSTRIKTWFEGADNTRLGAFYVYIKSADKS